MKTHFCICLTMLCIAMCIDTVEAQQHLSSPDGRVDIEFVLTDNNDTDDSIENPAVASLQGDGVSYYRIAYDGKPFLDYSRLGLELIGTAELNRYFKVTDVVRSSHSEVWKPVYGEKKSYPDNYNQMEIVLSETIYPFRRMTVTFRAYDEGVAFRYEIPEQNGMRKVVVGSELTEFVFPKNTSVWEEHGHEGRYHKVLVGEVRPDCELPLTCMTQRGVYGAIMEAGNSHYPRAYLSPATSKRTDTLRIALRGEAKSEHGILTAWRAVTLADSPGKLMENNYLLYNLNEPCKIEDTSWIKPGTAMRETTISTPEAYRMIDYCADMGIDYMIFDWGWYGEANNHRSDPSAVNVTNPTTGIPIAGHAGLDLPSVIEYASDNGVGIFLYVNRQGLERYADKIFPLYQKWGVRGIKLGFINVGNQEWQEWTEELVAKAAAYRLLVDIHDAYRPNGFSRTYPNLLTQEGVHGNEQVPDADHNATLPFVRFTIGAADYTPGYTRADLQPTFAHRLALPIIYYSPAQFLFWNEKLTDAHRRPELSLWKNIPTVWHDTRVLSGEIGSYAVVARESAEGVWYVGGITDTESRKIKVDLSFLEKGGYEVEIYTDSHDKNGEVKVEKRKVSAGESLDFDLMPSGGFAMRIRSVE